MKTQGIFDFKKFQKKKLRLIDINKEDLILKQLSDYFIKSFQYKKFINGHYSCSLMWIK